MKIEMHLPADVSTAWGGTTTRLVKLKIDTESSTLAIEAPANVDEHGRLYEDTAIFAYKLVPTATN